MDTAGMSRSEIRQLEKLQAMEAEKRKAEAPAPSSVAKKTTPARPAAAPATTPRATTGGKSMGLKGRAAAGGKSMGGKRPPQQPQSKKRKAGKKKKGDSSDSSSEESDSDSSSSSSSDDDQEEVAAKMPVKKRGKLTPATPKPDSGDESSDFEPEFDNNFFKSDDDRKWLMSLSEMDREQIITERREKQELQREAWQLEHSKRKAAARAGASAVKAKEAKEPATPGPSASVARGRASREGNKAVDKNADKRAALEDMEARKVEQQQKRLGARADVMEEDDDDAPRKRQEERQAMKPRHRQIPQEEKYPLMEPKELEAVRVSRDRLIEYAQSPFFGEFVQGMFVRVTLGKNAEGKQRYLVCVVIGVKDKQTEYNVYCPVTRKQVTLRKHLTVKHAGEKKAYPITVVSNKPFEESEVRKWCRDMHNDKEDLPEKAELEELRGKVAKNRKEAFVYDEDTVESILQEKERAHRNEASGNVHIKKMKLEDELEIAWEHYKELQKEGKDQEMQNDAYGQWEQLKQQIEIYDEAVQRKKHTAESEAARHKVINSRNMSANRTVTKSIDSARNITCTRPYRQTVYFAFGKSEVANKIAEDDRFTGNELKQQKPVNKVLAPEELVKLDDEEEEEGGGEGGNAAAAQSMEVGDTLTSEEAASALQRAHISLNVQVDVGGQGATKKVAGEEGGGVLPWARAPNPLKPAPAAAPAASAGAKNKLSLDDYKRRRGLI